MVSLARVQVTILCDFAGAICNREYYSEDDIEEVLLHLGRGEQMYDDSDDALSRRELYAALAYLLEKYKEVEE